MTAHNIWGNRSAAWIWHQVSEYFTSANIMLGFSNFAARLKLFRIQDEDGLSENSNP